MNTHINGISKQYSFAFVKDGGTIGIGYIFFLIAVFVLGFLNNINGPLIESQKAVKASIDKEQNAMIEELQKNQKALTEGLDKNRLAITSGFDKMDEVKRSDLKELPGFEAIEHPEIKEFT